MGHALNDAGGNTVLLYQSGQLVVQISCRRGKHDKRFTIQRLRMPVEDPGG